MPGFCSIDEMAKAAPFTEVYPGLFMGSKRAITKDALQIFDVYISAADEVKPPRSSEGAFLSYHIALDDIPWDFMQHPEEVQTLIAATKDIALMVKGGKRVLIFCHMGMNRSGLLTALTLINLGISADNAVEMIRKRHCCALSNQSFTAVLPYAQKIIRTGNR